MKTSAPSVPLWLNSSLSRREALCRTSLGFGSLALAGLMNGRAFGAGLPVGAPHFAPRAKRVIFAYMSGGVSHVDSFDPKPALAQRHGQPMPVPVKPDVADVGVLATGDATALMHGKADDDFSGWDRDGWQLGYGKVLFPPQLPVALQPCELAVRRAGDGEVAISVPRQPRGRVQFPLRGDFAVGVHQCRPPVPAGH